MVKTKILEWKCPECNKEITSTHKGQFEYNKEQHIGSHKRHQDSMIRKKPLPVKELEGELGE